MTEDDFRNLMLQLYERIKREVPGYTPAKFRMYIETMGAVEMVKTIIRKNEATEGYMTLLEAGRLDLTAEYVVLDTPQCHHFFDEEDLKRCRQRLGDHAPPA